VKVLAISGSLRRGSHNTALLRAAAEHAPDGVEFDLYDGLESLPPYNEDRDTEQPPATVADLRERVAAADAVLISTPEYNGTIPGQLKHLVDWASRPYGPGAALYGKPVAVVGASVSDYGALWAQDHLRKALAIAGARVAEVDLPVGAAAAKFDADGRLTDPETIERLEEAMVALAEHHRSVRLAV
jgi:chromate reductase, NAD(P)H dehydrogenase (quinone)